MKNGIDEASVEGVVDSPYLAAIPARKVTLHSPRRPIPVLWWRSVGNSHTAFAMESMVDELAHAAGQDPLASSFPARALAPARAACSRPPRSKAGWGAPLPGTCHGARDPRLVREHGRPGGGGLGGARRAHPRPPGGLRPRLWPANQPARASRPRSRAASPSGSGPRSTASITFREGRVSRATSTTTRSFGSTRCRGSRSTSSRATRRWVASASLDSLQSRCRRQRGVRLTGKRLRSLPFQPGLSRPMRLVPDLLSARRRAARRLLARRRPAGGHGEPASAAAPRGPVPDFETVRAVLQSPRCQNCHPAIDRPLQGDLSLAHTMNVQRGPDGHGVPGAHCATCHGKANPPDSYGAHQPPGVATDWHLPPPDMKMVFVGRSAEGALRAAQGPRRETATRTWRRSCST